MPGIDFRQVRDRVAIGEVLELLHFQAVRSWRGQVRGPCPLHGSRTPTSCTFSAHLSRNVFQCFKCGAAGNALDLWAAATRQNVYAAALDLCNRLHREVPWLPAADQRRGSRKEA